MPYLKDISLTFKINLTKMNLSFSNKNKSALILNRNKFQIRNSFTNGQKNDFTHQVDLLFEVEGCLNGLEG